MADPGPLIEPLIPVLRRYAYALTRNREFADDLVQDTLERALARWYLRRIDGDLRAWLFTILRNLYINAHRRDKRQGRPVEVDAATDVLVASDRPDSGLEMQDVLAALNDLPEEQRSLLLVGVEDLSYQDAATVMGVPIGTVMSRLSRARQRLRQLLETGTRVGLAPLRRVK